LIIKQYLPNNRSYLFSSSFDSSFFSKASTSSSNDEFCFCKSSDSVSFTFFSSFAISFSISEDESVDFISISTQVDLIHNSNKSKNHHQMPAGNVNAILFEYSKYFQLKALAKLRPSIANKITKTKTPIHFKIGTKEIKTIGNKRIHNHIACFR
jgi:hypothetical protein